MLSTLSFERADFPDFPFKTEMNNCDMSEVLNLQPSETKKVRKANLLTARPFKLSLRYEVDQVLEVAQDWVSMTELMRRFGHGDRLIRKELTVAEVPSLAGLWERATAEACVITIQEKRSR